MAQERDPFADAILEWFAAHRRDLPWRRLSHDSYAVWISEIMLQQTTVAAVIPFYERWMARFPDVHSLADAPLDDVLRHWAGLGYYARARNLHRGAQEIVRRCGGHLPSNEAQLLALPGIGRYTAGAIRSIAFNQEAPILDANVMRVLSRIHAVTGDPKTSAAVQTRLWQLAEEHIPHGHAGDFNQSMMELGALVCSAAAPRCGACPVQRFCAANRLGDPTGFPQLGSAKRWLDVEDVSVAIRGPHGRILLTQRPPEASLWGGLWELPRATRRADERPEQSARRAACETAGIALDAVRGFGQIKHVVANRRITLHGYTAQAPSDVAPIAAGCARWEWVAVGDTERYAVATPQQRLLALLERDSQQPRLALE